MMGLRDRGVMLVVVLGLAAVLSACGSKVVNRAPIEERMPVAGGSAGVAVAPATAQPPGFENAGKAGYYTVKPGDTMTRIGLETGQSWRDIARWNGLVNPNLIEVGQVLRVVPPLPATVASVPPATVIAAAPKSAASAAVAPVAPAASATGATTAPVQGSAVTSTAVAPSSVTATPVPPAQVGNTTAPSEDEVALIWPASGAVLAGFDEIKNKGLDIGGAAGDPVFAAADGRVVYVGSGLRGYGNLIILKHNNTYLTAYAHNQALLVKEDQTVRKGQKIAEMGNSDADRTKLHFEVRRQGKPVDPVKYLPAR
ncbi:MAG: peptidoglycan DD-metalloendopeptidase family protein [Rhodoferax sp.]|nr:peptidoglycan DD-metalloendopeptidase family protein [Rhodoferax sp.]MBP9928105.1 peptidoglycan DD-metalloendopeptidase family protein [Rhodoferax sp.]HQZ06494.1 peptidoglycan DD-metalloendopeptidase family protein [Burkholderiaceae bacterium]HRA63901.1 peptidoglycan DD-metalloendopeptidase family protein [Burkholderiaceae bacterium]